MQVLTNISPALTVASALAGATLRSALQRRGARVLFGQADVFGSAAESALREGHASGSGERRPLQDASA